MFVFYSVSWQGHTCPQAAGNFYIRRSLSLPDSGSGRIKRRARRSGAFRRAAYMACTVKNPSAIPRSPVAASSGSRHGSYAPAQIRFAQEQAAVPRACGDHTQAQIARQHKKRSQRPQPAAAAIGPQIKLHSVCLLWKTARGYTHLTRVVKPF